jgi:hypothetical protein
MTVFQINRPAPVAAGPMCLGCEAFLEWTGPDDEVGDDLMMVVAMNVRAAAPGHEQGIILHVRHDREKSVLHATPTTRTTAGTNGTLLR